MTQYDFGIEGLTDDEIASLYPRRVSEPQLRNLANGKLLRLRNIVMHEQGAYQNARHARMLSDRLHRIEAEMDRRGLSQWLDRGCLDCQKPWRLQFLGDDLTAKCDCTDQLDWLFRPRACVRFPMTADNAPDGR